MWTTHSLLVPTYQVLKKIADIEYVALKGGFQYKPWVISGENVPDQFLAAPVESLNTEAEKALGVYWDVRNDKFFVKVEAQGRKKNAKISLLYFAENPHQNLVLRTREHYRDLKIHPSIALEQNQDHL